MSRITAAILAMGLFVPTLCSAQHPEFKTTSLADMRRDAIESTNITVGPFLLWFASRVISSHDPHGAAVKDLLCGLHKVQVHSYRYDADHVYSQAALESLRSQLSAPGWHRMVQVRDHRANEDVDVYYTQDNRRITGLVVLSVEPREFTLVNISGTIDLKNVAALRDTFAPHGPSRSQDPEGGDQPTNPVQLDVTDHSR